MFSFLFFSWIIFPRFPGLPFPVTQWRGGPTFNFCSFRIGFSCLTLYFPTDLEKLCWNLCSDVVQSLFGWKTMKDDFICQSERKISKMQKKKKKRKNKKVFLKLLYEKDS